jgi:hypothetical protein
MIYAMSLNFRDSCAFSYNYAITKLICLNASRCPVMEYYSIFPRKIEKDTWKKDFMFKCCVFINWKKKKKNFFHFPPQSLKLEKDVFQNYSSLPENTFLQRFFIFNECF